MTREQMEKLLELMYIMSVLKRPDSKEAIEIKQWLLKSCS